MPFTPTHILAVVPIAAVRPGWLPFAALAIGSMIPDFPLFVPGSPWPYSRTHSILGLVAADLPLGLVGYLTYLGLLRRPIFALLPDAWQGRCVDLLRRRIPRSPGEWLRVATALVVGAVTHLAWDSFTHRGRWGTEVFPRLNGPALSLGGMDMPGYQVLQYGCTIVGMPALALLAAAWFRRQAPEPAEGSAPLPTAGRAAVLAGLGLAAAVGGAWAGRSTGPTPHERVVRVITGGSLALGLVLLAYAIAFEVLRSRARPGPDRD